MPEQERVRGEWLAGRPRAGQVCEWGASPGGARNTSSVYAIVWRLRAPRPPGPGDRYTVPVHHKAPDDREERDCSAGSWVGQ